MLLYYSNVAWLHGMCTSDAKIPIGHKSFLLKVLKYCSQEYTCTLTKYYQWSYIIMVRRCITYT